MPELSASKRTVGLLALVAIWPAIAGCSSIAPKPAYQQEKSWTDKMGAALKGNSAKVAAKPKATPDPLTHGKPGPAVLVAAAQMHEQRGQIEEAEDQYQKALKADPNCLGALVGYAHLEDRRDHFDAATKYYQRAIKAHPKDAAAYNDFGLCYHRRGMLPEANKMLSKAVELRPQRTLYRDNLASVLVEQGKTEEALQQLTMAHGVAVGNYNLGYLLVQKHQESKALAHFRKAAERDPSLAEAQHWVAELSGGADRATLAGANDPQQPFARTASMSQPGAYAAPGPSVQNAPLRYPQSYRNDNAAPAAMAPVPR